MTGLYKMRSAKMRKCENGQSIKCEIESAKWRCENVYNAKNDLRLVCRWVAGYCVVRR